MGYIEDYPKQYKDCAWLDFDTLERFMKDALMAYGVPEKDAEIVGDVLIESDKRGIDSHGIGRLKPIYLDRIDAGTQSPITKIDILKDEKAVAVLDGNNGMGHVVSHKAMSMAIDKAKEYGIGCVALGNNNHWMRGGTYGWLAADNGCIGICWSNTMPNMPAWGGLNRKIGNNPLIMAVPRSNGEHAMIDCAVSQFSYGKIEDCRLNGRQLPVPGGYDTKGNLTTDPAEIEKTWRVLPMGYWKGSGLSIVLDLIATVLTNGNSVSRIGTFGDEVGLTQIMIAIDPSKFNTVDETDAIVDEILADVKSSQPIEEGGEIYYPGELELKNIRENKEKGIPVVDEVWESVLKM